VKNWKYSFSLLLRRIAKRKGRARLRPNRGFPGCPARRCHLPCISPPLVYRDLQKLPAASTGIPQDREQARARVRLGEKRGAAKIPPSNVPLPAQATIYEPLVPTAAFASDCLLLALESSYSFQEHEQERQINFSPGWSLGIRQNQCGQIQFS
jgi:hypothetical protein